MIERQFGDSEGSEPVGFSHSDFCFVVQTFDHAAGELFPSAKIVEDEFAVGAQSSGDFLHGLDPRTHHLATPLVEELGGPSGGLVVPELLEVFLEQIGAHALEVVAYQVLQFHFLVGGEVGRPLEKAPSRLSQDR